MRGTAGPPAPASHGSGHAPLHGGPRDAQVVSARPCNPQAFPCTGKEREIGIQREQHSVGNDGNSDLVDESKLLQTAGLVGSENVHGMCVCHMFCVWE